MIDDAVLEKAAAEFVSFVSDETGISLRPDEVELSGNVSALEVRVRGKNLCRVAVDPDLASAGPGPSDLVGWITDGIGDLREPLVRLKMQEFRSKHKAIVGLIAEKLPFPELMDALRFEIVECGYSHLYRHHNLPEEVERDYPRISLIAKCPGTFELEFPLNAYFPDEPIDAQEAADRIRETLRFKEAAGLAATIDEGAVLQLVFLSFVAERDRAEVDFNFENGEHRFSVLLSLPKGEIFEIDRHRWPLSMQVPAPSEDERIRRARELAEPPGNAHGPEISETSEGCFVRWFRDRRGLPMEADVFEVRFAPGTGLVTRCFRNRTPRERILGETDAEGISEEEARERAAAHLQERARNAETASIRSAKKLYARREGEESAAYWVEPAWLVEFDGDVAFRGGARVSALVIGLHTGAVLEER